MKTQHSKIQKLMCKDGGADADAELMQAGFATVIGGEGNVRDIQWAPPGTHEIVAHANGKAKKIKVLIDRAAADLVATRVRAMRADAAGKGTPLPYIDFDHEHNRASGIVLEASWGGDDPKTGGVRLKVELTKSGLEAVQGKDYQAFSPEWLVRDGKLVDVGTNLGGMVNDPAFRTIQRLWAKAGTTAADADGADADAHQPAIDKDKSMDKELIKLLAKLGFVSSEHIDATAAIAELSVSGQGLKDALTIKAKLAAEYVAKTDYDTLKAKCDALSKDNAERVVAKAVADGRLLAKDADGQKLWTERITANSADAKLLESIAPAKVPAQVVKAKATDAASTEVTTGDEHPLVVKAKAIATAKGISENEALLQAAEANPKLYDDYVEQLGKEEKK